MGLLQELSARHEKLKKTIHSTRIPLSKNGQRMMGLVYFSVPILFGYGVMKWTERQAAKNYVKEEAQIRSATDASTQQHIELQNAQLRQFLKDINK